MRFIISQENGLKYDRLKIRQNSGNIVYFGHVHFPALLGKVSYNNKLYVCTVRIVDKVRKEILLLEMSCLWITNRRTKEEKTRKYAPLRWELKQQYPGYEIKQLQ